MWIRCGTELYEIPKVHYSLGGLHKLQSDIEVTPESCLSDYLETNHKDQYVDLVRLISTVIIPQRGFSWLLWRQRCPPWINDESLHFEDIGEHIRIEFDKIFQPFICEVKHTEPYILKLLIDMLINIKEPKNNMFDYLIPLVRTMNTTDLAEIMFKITSEVTKYHPEHLVLFSIVPTQNQGDIWKLLHLCINMEIHYLRTFMQIIFVIHINLMDMNMVRRIFRLPIAHSASADATLASIMSASRHIEKIN